MFGILTTELIVLASLTIAWFTYSYKVKSNHASILNLSLLIALIIIVTFRDGSINPDYGLYLQYIYYPNSYSNEAESSFFAIAHFSKLIGSRYLFVFFVYAILGIATKLYAIYYFSTNVIYSCCIWLSFSFILHDLIQVRAAVSAGLLLLMIPYVCKEEYVKAIVVWIFAFLFHHSAIIFGLIFFLKKDIIKPWKWISVYVVVFLINLTNFPIFPIIFKILTIFPSFITERIGKSDPAILNELPRMTMYSRYILIPTITCFIAVYNRSKLSKISPYSIICLKVCLIGVYSYGIGLPIVSERVFEILSVPYIYLVPTSLYWFNHKSMLKGKILITIFCLFMSWNLLYKQEVFS